MPKKGHTKAAIAEWDAAALERKPIDVDSVLTVKDACAYLQVGADGVYDAIRRGLRHTRINRRGDLRFRRSWLDAYVEERSERHAA